MSYIKEQIQTNKYFKSILEGIERRLKYQNKINILITSSQMTQIILNTGIEKWFENKITFLHTLGCPYCYIDPVDLATMEEFLKDSGKLVLMKNQLLSLLRSRNNINGFNNDFSNVISINSEEDCLKLLQENKNKEIILFSSGFETETSKLASFIKECRELKISHFKIFLTNKLSLPAIKNILDKKVHIDGYLAPIDLALAVGEKGLNYIVKKYGIPVVISSNNDMEILKSIDVYLDNFMRNNIELINPYHESINDEEVKSTQQQIYDIFIPKTVRWAGYGIIPFSGLSFNEDYQDFALNNELKLKPEILKNPECNCDEILTINKKVFDCNLFNNICSISNPKGINMALETGLCYFYSTLNK